MKPAKIMKSLQYIISTMCLVLAFNANAAWFTVVVKNVAPSANGDVFVQMTPGTGETSFTGTARGILQNSDAGSNKMTAVLLTAISLDAEILVQMANTPSWAEPQVITNTGLENPAP